MRPDEIGFIAVIIVVIYYLLACLCFAWLDCVTNNRFREWYDAAPGSLARLFVWLFWPALFVFHIFMLLSGKVKS